MLLDLVQLAVNGLVMGAVIALPALGLTLIFSILGLINFSIAAQMTIGAFAGSFDDFLGGRVATPYPLNLYRGHQRLLPR